MTTFKGRAAAFAVISIAVVSCQMDPPANQVVTDKGKSAHDCIEGCEGPAMEVTLLAESDGWTAGHISNDTAYLPDSTFYYHSDPQLRFEVTNPSGSAVEEGVVNGASCSTSCVATSIWQDPTSPDPLDLDAYESNTNVYGVWTTYAPGTGTLTFSVGATEVDIPVVVFHPTVCRHNC